MVMWCYWCNNIILLNYRIIIYQNKIVTTQKYYANVQSTNYQLYSGILQYYNSMMSTEYNNH
jgi:hypothetical protein